MLSLFKTSLEFDQETGLVSISGPTRYFLYRLMSDADACGTPVTVADFVKRYGLNDRVVSKAINQLIGAGLVTKELVRSESKKGRNQYFLDEGFAERISRLEIGKLAISVEEVVKHVLTAGGGEVGRPGSKWLTPYNRLVLAVLLVRSDAAGAVYDVGASDLKRIAGLSADRLRSQLSKLMELGFIRCRVSGVTGQHLFGRSKGAYFLNLAHPDFRELGGQSCVVIRLSLSRNDERRYGTAYGIYIQAKAILSFERNESGNGANNQSSRNGGMEPLSILNAKIFEQRLDVKGNRDEPLGLVRFFSDEPIAVFSSYLQMLVNRYATQLLNSCLSDGDDDKNEENTALLEQIKRDLSAADGSLLSVSAIAEAIANVSKLEALKVREALVSDSEIRRLARSGVRCQILPLYDPNETRFWTSILLYGKDLPNDAKNCVWRINMKPSNSKKAWIQDSKSILGPERELRDDWARAWGLRSIGKRYPKSSK